MSKYTFVESDFLSNLDDEFISYYQREIEKAKTSNGEELFDIGYKYMKNSHFNPKYNPRLAYPWLRLASLKNNADAQYKLAKMYLTGEGVQEDRLACYGWLLTASSNGNRRAWKSIGGFFSFEYNYWFKGIIPQDNHKAMQWYCKYNNQSYLVSCIKKDYNCFLSKQDKNKSMTQLVAEAEELLNAAYQKRREEEEKVEREQSTDEKLNKFKKTRKPTKKQLRDSFDPFVFHPKRK